MRLKKTGATLLLAITLLATGCVARGQETPPSPEVSASVAPPPPSPSATPSPSVPLPTAPKGYVYDPKHCGVTPSQPGAPAKALLTIDDFPYEDGEVIVKVAEWAKQSNTMMHAFPVGDYVGRYNQAHHTDLVARARELGTYVSNHTYSHANLADLAKINQQAAKNEIKKGIASTYVRPPYGAYDDATAKLINDYGARVCDWTIDTGDWKKHNNEYPSVASLVATVRSQLNGLKPGEPVVILGHYQTNYPAALPAIRHELVKAGLQVCESPKTATTATVPYPICA